MNEIKVFENQEFGQVRTVMNAEGDIMFCGNDVAKALGYAKPANAIATHCKGVTISVTPSPGGMQKTKFIPEGDVYRLVVRSKLPTAANFERWVFDSVLPSLRKNGGYIMNQEKLTPEQIVANALVVAQNIINNQKAQLEEMTPKAIYYDGLVERNLLLNFRDTAKEIGVKQNFFIKWLENKGYVYRDNKNRLLPYATKNDGLFEMKEFKNENGMVGSQTLITVKGRDLFMNKLTNEACGG